MKVFTTSSGYRFNLYEPGDVCRIVNVEFAKTFIKPGTAVKVLTNPDDFSRTVHVIHEETGIKYEVNISQLELVEPSLTYDAAVDLGVVSNVTGDGSTDS